MYTRIFQKNPHYAQRNTKKIGFLLPFQVQIHLEIKEYEVEYDLGDAVALFQGRPKCWDRNDFLEKEEELSVKHSF